MTLRSLGRDGGMEQYIGTDSDGTVILQTRYDDAQPILDRNAELRLHGSGVGREMRLAASIPPSLIHKWRVEDGVDIFSNDPWHKKRARELLNSNEYYRLRIWGGKI